MSEYSSLDDLFGMAATETADVDLPSGGRVKVRGLTRREQMVIGKASNGDPLEYEPHLLASCVVEPPMSVESAQRFVQNARVGDVSAISDRIRDLSGMSEGAAKSGVPAVGPE